MARIYIPSLTPLARAARGWPAPGFKPSNPVISSRSIAQGLCFAALPTRELVSNTDGWLDTNTTVGYDGQHKKIITPSTSDNYGASWVGLTPLTTSNGVGTGDFAIAVIAKPEATADATSMISQAGLGKTQTYLLANCEAGWGAVSGGAAFGVWDGSDLKAATATGVVDGNWHVFVGVRRGTGLYLYVDGRLVGTGTDSGPSNVYSNATGTALGGIYGYTSGWEFPYPIAGGAMWNRALSPDECVTLGQDFYLPFLPANQSLFLIGTAAEATTSQYFIPAGTPIHKALSGWPAPGVKPTAQGKPTPPYPNASIWPLQGTLKGYGADDLALNEPSNISWGASRGNQCLTIAGTPSNNSYASASLSEPDTFTLFLDFELNELPSGNAGLFSWADGPESGSPWIYLRLETSGVLKFYVNTNYRSSLQYTLSAGNKYNIALQYDGTQWHRFVYENNTFKGKASYTGGTGFYAANDIYISSGFGGQVNCNWFNVEIFRNVVIPDAAILNHQKYPYEWLAANQSPFLIGVSGGAGGAYEETLSASVTSSATLAESYDAPDYSETLASSVTSSATLVESYQAAGYNETLASSVTSSATLVETYDAPAYSETLASSVTSSASLVEAYELGAAYQETLSAAVTSSASLVETYVANYQETLTAIVTSAANLVEGWTVDYQELLASSVTSSANLGETFESGLDFAETLQSSVTSSANLAETYGAPDYTELLESSVTSTASLVEQFTTPQALPALKELTATALKGYGATTLPGYTFNKLR